MMQSFEICICFMLVDVYNTCAFPWKEDFNCFTLFFCVLFLMFKRTHSLFSSFYCYSFWIWRTEIGFLYFLCPFVCSLGRNKRVWNDYTENTIKSTHFLRIISKDSFPSFFDFLESVQKGFESNHKLRITITVTTMTVLKFIFIFCSCDFETLLGLFKKNVDFWFYFDFIFRFRRTLHCFESTIQRMKKKYLRWSKLKDK